MAGILDFISNFIDITGDFILDNILFVLIGLIAFYVAFGLTRDIFDKLDFHNSAIMSIVHWLIRIVLFFGLIVGSILLIKLLRWLLSIKWWIYLIIGTVFLIAVVIILLIRKKNKKSNNDEKRIINLNSLKGITEEKNDKVIIFDNNKCPWCGGKLVERDGPYGKFYGCSNYYSKGCKYTRSIWKRHNSR